MDKIVKNLFLLILFISSFALTAHAYSALVLDSITKDVLGSASFMCPTKASEGKLTYLTAAHVVQRRKNVILRYGTSNRKLKVLFSDPLFDLAVLDAGVVPLNLFQPCVRLSGTMSLPVVENSLAAIDLPEGDFVLDAFSRNGQKLVSTPFHGQFSQRLDHGFLGREFPARIIVVRTPMKIESGISGGLLMGIWNPGSGRLLRDDDPERSHSVQVAVGMAIAAKKNDRLLAILPAPAIYQRLKQLFQRQIPKKVNANSSEIKYVYADEGWEPIGTSLPVDGDLSGEGIVFQQSPQKVWKTLNTDTQTWVLGEKMSHLLDSKISASPQGIYKTQDKLFLSNSTVKFPRLRLNSPCQEVQALASHGTDSLTTIVTVEICQNFGESQKTSLEIRNGTFNDRFKVELETTKKCQQTREAPCEMISRGFMVGPQGTTPLARKDLFQFQGADTKIMIMNSLQFQIKQGLYEINGPLESVKAKSPDTP